MAQIASTPSSIRRFRCWTIAVAALASLLLAASASAATQDLSSPDAHAGTAAAAQPATADPWAQSPPQDLRSPDARESGSFVSSPQDGTGSSSGSDWVYLALGGLASLSLIGASVLLVQRHRRHAIATTGS